MHLLPVENADGTVTYMLISLNNEQAIRADSITTTAGPSASEGTNAIIVDKGGLTSSQLLECVAEKAQTANQPIQFIIQQEADQLSGSNDKETEYVLLTDQFNQ